MNLNHINWNHFYYFYEVAKRLSMKKASFVLKVTVPTISDQVKKLENELNVKLFDRKSRSLILTHNGKDLYDKVNEIFSNGKRLMASLDDGVVGGYQVKIGIENPILSVVNLDFLLSYWDLYAPYGTISTDRYYYSHTLSRELQSRVLDWTLSFEPLINENVETLKIGYANIVFCCSKEIFENYSNKTDILKELPMGQFKNAHYFNNFIFNRLMDSSVNPHEVINSDEEGFLYKLLAHGRIFMALSEKLVKQIGHRQNIYSFSLKNFKIHVPVFISYLKDNKNLLHINNLNKILDTKDLSSLQKGPLWQLEANG